MMHPYEQAIREFERQLNPKRVTAQNFTQLKRSAPRAVAIIGMGGSGLAGEILRAAQSELNIKTPVILWKDYGLPPHLPSDALHVFVSFSGDTEETLSGLSALLKAGTARGRIALITSGGGLRRIGERRRLPMALFSPEGLTPRQGTGIMFTSLVTILRAAGIRARLPKAAFGHTAALEHEGKRIARALKDKVITIYTDEAWRALGYIWKIKLNETAKALTFSNVLPEADHNEIVGYERKSFPTAALFLKNPTATPQFEKRRALTKRLLARRGVSVVELPPRGKTVMGNAWRTIALADWTAYFLARLRRIDPTETNIIRELKEGLKK